MESNIENDNNVLYISKLPRDFNDQAAFDFF